MNIISCECGVVLDKDKLQFPDSIYTNDMIDDEKAMWDGEDWVAKTQCPVCGEDVPETA